MYNSIVVIQNCLQEGCSHNDLWFSWIVESQIGCYSYKTSLFVTLILLNSLFIWSLFGHVTLEIDQWQIICTVVSKFDNKIATMKVSIWYIDSMSQKRQHGLKALLSSPTSFHDHVSHPRVTIYRAQEVYRENIDKYTSLMLPGFKTFCLHFLTCCCLFMEGA